MSKASGVPMPKGKAKPNSELQRTLGYIAAVVLFLVIFFSNIRPVGGAQSEGGKIDVCAGRGYKNATTGLCACIDNYYGYNCHLKYCPFGKSWLSAPVANQARNREYAACSNMGTCNPFTGRCTCRPHYEGRACERYSCASSRTGLSGGFAYSTSPTDPTTNLFSEAFLTSYLMNPPELQVHLGGSSQNLAGHLYETTPDAPYSRLPPGAAIPCSGHGICRTMAEAASGWNGVSLTRPPLSYTNWEADSFQGCLCDYGWNGYDCGDRACPFGRDPQDTSGATNEFFLLQCAADAGFFTIHLLGHATFPLPFDADPSLVKGALEELPNVGTVHVKMQKDSLGLPSACGATALVTTIQLLNFPGRQRTIKVSNASASTRQFPSGGTPLTLSSGPSSLSLLTQYKLTCPAGCSGCTGYVYLVYGDSVSGGVDVTAAGAPALLAAALSQLTNLTAQHFPTLTFAAASSVSTASPLCGSASHTVTLTLSSSLGNIGGLSILDSTHAEEPEYVSRGFGRKRANVTLSSNLGSGALYECSNQGICDRRTGVCGCFSAAASGGDATQAASLAYQATSSDGNGNTGRRGDCGSLRQFPSASTDEESSCVLPGGLDRCSGHGTCTEVTSAVSYTSSGEATTTTTGGCTCYPPWHGVNCAVATCPFGPAWFDEATSANTAHAPAECSNMGICDRSTGTCFCREGFTGQACDLMDCPRDADTGEPCSGHGYCETMSSLFSLYGFSYGYAPNEAHQPQAWDAFIWQECVCYAKFSAGTLAHPLRPATSPALSARGAHSEGPASSAAGAVPVPGWTGWDCSLRMCPKGDDIDKFGTGDATRTPTHYGITLRAEQRVVCRQSVNTLLADAWGGYGNGSFVLSFFGAETQPILPTFRASQIREAIQAASTIGTVTVSFPLFERDNISTACSPAANLCVCSPLSLFFFVLVFVCSRLSIPAIVNFLIPLSPTYTPSSLPPSLYS